MKKNIAFTIVAKNYLHYALTLSSSFSKQNPEFEFRIYISDGVTDDIKKLAQDKNLPIFDAMTTQDAPDFLKMAFYYEVTEYCTAIKPFLIRQLFAEGNSIVCYIDPDIYFYSSLDGAVCSTLVDDEILLTPHICSPIGDSLRPSESDHLISGTYNLGFIALRQGPESTKLVDWWCKKCLDECFTDPINGLFVDQKWINLVPGMFSKVHISRNLGLNVAYWNFHERILDESHRVNGSVPLTFFHFSGINVDSFANISKYQNRFSLANRPDLRPYFEAYAAEVRSNRFPEFEKDYAFNQYSDGKQISILARRLYFWNRGSLASPFQSTAAEAAFKQILKKSWIKEKGGIDKKPAGAEVAGKKKILDRIFFGLLLLLGPQRYGHLMRYFGLASSLNNHKFLDANASGATSD